MITNNNNNDLNDYKQPRALPQTVQKLELKKSTSFENEVVRGCIIIALRDRSLVVPATNVITPDPNELPEGLV